MPFGWLTCDASEEGAVILGKRQKCRSLAQQGRHDRLVSLIRPTRRTVLLVLSLGMVLVLVTGLSAGWQRMEDVNNACANVFDSRKAELTGYGWGWLPPGWVCTYAGGDERRLPVMQR